jgi:4-amino-4-deoxy-L-arabinose transferase-like glycosyltransferase
LGSDVLGARTFTAQPESVAVDRVSSRLLVAALGVALAAVYVPMALFRLVDADEGIYLLNAKMVLNGDLPYHDFFYPQMPLLPYVYGLWMKLFGVSWYSGRLLSAFLAVALGLIVYAHVARLTRSRPLGILAVSLFASSTLCLAWLSAAKTFSLATFLLFASYAVVFSRRHRWKYFLSGLLLGLAIDTRLYLVVVIPLLLLHLVRTETEGRRLQIGRFTTGLVLALLPNEFFLLMDPDVYFFNILGVHGIRSPFGMVGLVSQKVDLLADLLGVNPTYGNGNLQFTLLLLVTAVTLAARLRPKAPFQLSAGIALTVIVVSLVPTPTYAQYFCIAVPFLIVNAALFCARLRDDLSSPGGQAFRRIGHALAAAVLVAYLLPAPFEAYRYTVGGDRVPGVFTHADAHNWTIPMIRQVSRAIDEVAPTRSALTLTWWPGYLLETNGSVLPRLENPYALWYSPHLSPLEITKYKFMSSRELEWHIGHHTASVAVVGNWMFDTKPSYRDLLTRGGYVLTRRVGEAEIYAWRSR